MKKLISVLLLLAMLAISLASCGGSKETGATTAAQTESGTAGETTAQSTEDEKWEEIASKIAIITENDRKLRIELSNHGDAEKTSKNDKYVVGPDVVDPGTTPLIEQMVYARNKAAYDLLNVKIEYVYWDYKWSEQSGQIEKVVQAKAPDAPDLFVNMISDLNVANLKGVFKDTWSIPNAYFDFETQGWMTDYMRSLSLIGDRSYILAGDYFLDILRALGVLPVNITMMDANAEKLAPAIIGENGDPLGEGEDLSTRFFDFVEQGKWTWDVLGKLCAAIWVDENNDGRDSITDVLGIVADNYGGLTSEMYIFSASEDDLFDVRPIEDESSPYYGKDWIYYSEDSTALGKIFDAVAAVYTGSGSVSTKGNYEASTPDNPGATYHRIKFAEGTMLTAGTVVLGALEDEQFQRMTDIFTVVPLPKISEEKHYNTCVHTIGDAGAINVNSNPRKARVLSAFLQYNCEHSAAIRREFLEIVMKYKTTVYNQGTDRMLDIIYDSVITGRDKMIEDCVGTDYRYFWIMMRGNCEVTSATLASGYQSYITTKQTMLDKIIRTWYTLPKS